MIEYQKYSGAGNTFLIVNNLKNEKLKYAKIVEELISENPSFDGVIFLENSSIADFCMNYFNKDGTGNALCGNGLRCTAKYIIDNNICDNDFMLIEAVSKIYTITVFSGHKISVGFPAPYTIKLNFNLKVHFSQWWSELQTSYFDVGSPHIVVIIDDIKKPKVSSIDEIPIDEWGKFIRMHKDLLPDGANVNFIEIINKENSELKIRSFERGVEAETLACGTGALSSAISAHIKREIQLPIKLLTKSGEYLVVNFEIVNDEIKNLTLAGNAVRID